MHGEGAKFAYSGSMLNYEITVKELKELQASEKPPVLVDVREPWEVATASLPGALVIPMGEIPTRYNNELDPDQHIIVMCHHGARSLNVTAWLRNQGYEQTQSLAGGIDQWSREIDPTVPLY